MKECLFCKRELLEVEGNENELAVEGDEYEADIVSVHKIGKEYICTSCLRKLKEVMK